MKQIIILRKTQFLIISVILIFLFWDVYQLQAQTIDSKRFFREIELRIDTTTFRKSTDEIWYRGNRFLGFRYEQENETCEIRLYSKYPDIQKLTLLENSDFEILDSIKQLNSGLFRAKIRFKNITQSRLLNLIFELKLKRNTKSIITEIQLLPFTNTYLNLSKPYPELYIGEEKILEISSNHPDNIRPHSDWQKTENFDYKISKNNQKLYLHLIPHQKGNQEVTPEIFVFHPHLEKKIPVYILPPETYQFTVKKSRLAFLRSDSPEILKVGNRPNEFEIQLDYVPRFQPNKTYRITNQEDKNGKTIAEIFTLKRLSNNKMLCRLRVYDYHKTAEGYLYIKDGDKAQFLTNFNILPEVKIHTISILRNGKQPTSDLSVFAGEQIILKIEGETLHRANFQFEGVQIRADSTVKTENTILYKMEIPYDIQTHKIQIYDGRKTTPFALKIKEYQRPHPLNFLEFDLGDKTRKMTDFSHPLFFDKTIKDLVIRLLPNKLDSGKNLFGKQYLNLKIRLTDKDGKLIENAEIQQLVVCPADNSLRGEFYDKNDCQMTEIRLNDYLRNKTMNLEGWSKIELTISHLPEKYSEKGETKRIEIYLQQKSVFDIDLSFPGGLFLKKVGEHDWGMLSGISMGVLAQFKFYRKDRVAHLRPYRFGIGTLAFNVFNFSEDNTNRDLAVVALGSIFPTRKNVKLTLPLYAGFGYMIREDRFFFVLGPGLRIHL